MYLLLIAQYFINYLDTDDSTTLHKPSSVAESTIRHRLSTAESTILPQLYCHSYTAYSILLHPLLTADSTLRRRLSTADSTILPRLSTVESMLNVISYLMPPHPHLVPSLRNVPSDSRSEVPAAKSAFS